MKRTLSTLAALACLTFPTTAVAGPAPEIRCYSGQTEVHLPNGRKVGSSEALVRRVVDQAGQLITEQVITIDARPNVPPREFQVGIAVNSQNGTFVMSERHGAFFGSGNLTGTPWHWSAWESQSTMADGSRVVSSDYRNGGELRAEKTYYDAAGTLALRFVETLHPISETDFQTRYGQVFSKP